MTIEIFINITVYLREDVIHVRLVVATALMAVARKVIVFDFLYHLSDNRSTQWVILMGSNSELVNDLIRRGIADAFVD